MKSDAEKFKPGDIAICRCHSSCDELFVIVRLVEEKTSFSNQPIYEVRHQGRVGYDSHFVVGDTLEAAE